MKHLLWQVVHFIGLSGIGWLLDFCVYAGLSLLRRDLVLNTMISSWVGVTFVFAFATTKVFKNNNRMSLKWKYALYLCYQCVLIFFISKLLNMINGFIISTIEFELIYRFSAIISKVFVTPITMILNFGVMKGVIERS